MQAPDDALLCPITLDLFRDPVVAQDGHTYERTAIEEWVKMYGTSPLTNRTISLEHVVPNYAIKKLIDRFESYSREKNFQYTLDVDVKKKKGRALFETYGKKVYLAEWLPNNDGRPEIILMKIDGARANKEASFYVDISRHPHIVRTFGLVRENDNVSKSVMLLQEFASEGNLSELLSERKKPLAERVLLEIFLQILDAMSYLSLNHVIHGDLACRNVLIFRFDEKEPRNIVVKIADFGLSRYSNIYSQITSSAETTLNIIPKRYCAPEILLPAVTSNDYTEKSDVYSLGVLMWEAYSGGAIPWTNIENDDEVARRVRNGDTLSQPANCSSPYWKIIVGMWAPSPVDRPTFDQLKKLFKEQLYQNTTSSSVPKISLSRPNYDFSGQQQNRNACPAYYKPTYGPSTQQPPSPGVNNAATGSAPPDQLKLVGRTVQIDKRQCYVMAKFQCGTEELYAVECDKPMKGYNGRCPRCDHTHVAYTDPKRGFYVSVKSLHDHMEQQKLADERAKGPRPVHDY